MCYHTITPTNILTGNSFKQLSDDFIDESKSFIDLQQKPNIIFLYTDWVNIFAEKVLPKIDYPFKLITHNSDASVNSNHIHILENKHLIRWYGMNCHIQHPKLQPIPIGIANEKWPHGNKNTISNVSCLDIKKRGLCYSNFDINTNITKRTEAFRVISSKYFITADTCRHTFESYLIKLKSYKYTISPPGNSVDCHRIWEAIYLGVVPIVERNVALEYFYDLPLLVVDSFKDLTEEYLHAAYEGIINKSRDKAFLQHYKKLILAN